MGDNHPISKLVRSFIFLPHGNTHVHSTTFGLKSGSDTRLNIFYPANSNWAIEAVKRGCVDQPGM